VSGIRQEVKVHPLGSTLKSMCELIKGDKMHIHSNFVNAMKNTPFGPTFMTFYN